MEQVRERIKALIDPNSSERPPAFVVLNLLGMKDKDIAKAVKRTPSMIVAYCDGSKRLTEPVRRRLKLLLATTLAVVEGTPSVNAAGDGWLRATADYLRWMIRNFEELHKDDRDEED